MAVDHKTLVPFSFLGLLCSHGRRVRDRTLALPEIVHEAGGYILSVQ